MYAIGPLHAPAIPAPAPLAPLVPTVDTDTDETDTSTTSSNIERFKDVVNKVVSVLTSKQAIFIFRCLATMVVVGVVLSWVVVLKAALLSAKLLVNTLSFTAWSVTMVNFVQAKTLGYKASARRSPSFWQVGMDTSSWCNVDAVQRVWDFTGDYCSSWWA